MSLLLKVMGQRLHRQHTYCMTHHGSDEPLVVSRPLARRGAGTSFAVCATLNGSKEPRGYLDMPPEDLDKKSAFAAGTAHEPEVRAKLVLGPYQLLQSIGVGGMGEVWLAE